jgi:cytochrome P450 family 6
MKTFKFRFETSSSVSTFAVYELALNQDIQDKLRNEIEEVLLKHNNEMSYDSIKEMRYLDMVFKESMRKYPIPDTQLRKCTKDFKIPNSDLTILAGDHIFIPVEAIHNDPEHFPDPEKFDPERFNEQNVEKIHPFSYIPFSEGPRICIGLRFGTMQAKIGLIKIIRNYRILTCSKTLIPLKIDPKSAFLNPLGGMWLKLEKIN